MKSVRILWLCHWQSIICVLSFKCNMIDVPADITHYGCQKLDRHDKQRKCKKKQPNSHILTAESPWSWCINCVKHVLDFATHTQTPQCHTLVRQTEKRAESLSACKALDIIHNINNKQLIRKKTEIGEQFMPWNSPRLWNQSSSPAGRKKSMMRRICGRDKFQPLTGQIRLF